MAVLPVKKVVTCFLESEGKILLLRRSRKVGTYRGKWAGVSGYLEHSPSEQALIEISEETGLSGDDVAFVRAGSELAFDAPESGVRWQVHPFLFRVKDKDKIKLDWEHTEAQWINPGDIGKYDTVPRLKETLGRVYPVNSCPPIA